MVDHSFTRRASYGPTSPTVGSRGARTRQQIVDAALAVFTQKGFHATAVEDICALAETSRATLYQYFESKEAVFVELMHIAGGELHAVTRRLESLGATVEGYDNLYRWLADWSQMFDRYASIFVEWANVNSPHGPLRRKLAAFVDAFVLEFMPVLTAAGYAGSDPGAAIIMTLAMANRFNYIRHVYRPALGTLQLNASLASALQLFLFPATPATVLAPGPRSALPTDGEVAPPPVANIGPLATLPPRDLIAKPKPFDGLSPQARTTVRRLLDAGGRMFAANGYEATNIDQIVTEARVARGTFYRYFDDKLGLMCALGYEAASVMCPLFSQFESFADYPDPARLRSWLDDFLAAERRYSGVMRSWTESFPTAPVLLASASDVVTALGRAVTATFGPPRPYPLDRRAVGMMMAGMLEHFPNEGTGSRYEPSDIAIVEMQALFIERVLFPR